jgi:hypothetical protein
MNTQDKKIDAPKVDAPVIAPAVDMAAWAAEAAAKAKANGRSRIEPGQVVDADPRLSYSVIDGDAPKPTQDRQKAFLEARGYRQIPGALANGFRAPIVMAIPIEVYRDVLHAERVSETRQRMKRWGAVMQVMQATEYS